MECIYSVARFLFSPPFRLYAIYGVCVIYCLYVTRSEFESRILISWFNFFYNVRTIYNAVFFIWPSDDTGLCQFATQNKIKNSLPKKKKKCFSHNRTFSGYKLRIFIIFCRFAFLHYGYMVLFLYGEDKYILLYITLDSTHI